MRKERRPFVIQHNFVVTASYGTGGPGLSWRSTLEIERVRETTRIGRNQRVGYIQEPGCLYNKGG